MPKAQKIGFDRRASDQHIIAERLGGTPWPVLGPAAMRIGEARADYEAGKVELATRREGRMEFLYAIPRKTVGTLRPGYFNTKH